MTHSNQVTHLCLNLTPHLLGTPPTAGMASPLSSTFSTSGPSRSASNSSHHQMEVPSTMLCKALDQWLFCELSMLLPLACSVNNSFTSRRAFQCMIRDTVQRRQFVGQWEPGRVQSENCSLTLPSLLPNTSYQITLPAPWRPLELAPDL